MTNWLIDTLMSILAKLLSKMTGICQQIIPIDFAILEAGRDHHFKATYSSFGLLPGTFKWQYCFIWPRFKDALSPTSSFPRCKQKEPETFKITATSTSVQICCLSSSKQLQTCYSSIPKQLVNILCRFN